MKYLLGVFLILWLPSYSQIGYPIIQILGSDSSVITPKGALKGRLINFVFEDTVQANTQRIKNYPGAQIFTSSDDKFWLRSADTTKWLPASGGGGGNDSALVGFRTISPDTVRYGLDNGDSTDLLFETINPISTVAGLRAMTTTPYTDVVYKTTDFCGGEWIWNPVSTATDNIGDKIKVGAIATGRFERQFINGVINPCWYGAVGDYDTDDATAVRAAVDYASSLSHLWSGPGFSYKDRYGAKVLFNEGVFKCNTSIEAKDGVTIEGAGMHSTIILFNTGTGVDGFYNTVPPSGASYSRINFKNISIHGEYLPPAARNTRDLISLNFARVNFENVSVLYAGRHPMLYDATVDATFTKCTFGNSGSHTFRLAQSDTLSTSIRFNNCYFKASVNGSGVMVDNVLGATFNSCVFESNGSSLAVNDSCGWGLISKKGHITFNQPYAENNYQGVLWLGQTREAPVSTFNGNRYYVYGLTHVNQNFKPAVRVDEAEMVVIRGDRHNNISTTGRALYQFYPKYALSYSIETSVTESSVEFYHQDLDTLIDNDKVPYLTSLTTAYSGDRNAYFGSRAIGYMKSLVLTGDFTAPANFNFKLGKTDGTTGYTGIGTTAPLVPVHIQGVSLGAIRIIGPGGTTWYNVRVAYNQTDPDLIFGTGDTTSAVTERFRWNNVGDYGSGVTIPTAKVHITAGTTLKPAFKIDPGLKTTTPQIGAIENDTTGGVNRLLFTRKDGTRVVLDSSGGTSSGSGIASLVIITDANYTIAAGITDVIMSAMTAARTLTLPSAASSTNRKITIKHDNAAAFNINLSINVRENPSTVTGTVAQNQWITIVSDGMDWWIVANK